MSADLTLARECSAAIEADRDIVPMTTVVAVRLQVGEHLRDALAEVDRLTAEIKRLRLDALDTVRIRAEHALLVHFAGQPRTCGQCGAAVMKGYCCIECRADPTEKVR